MDVTVNGESFDVPRREHLPVHELLKYLEVETENQSLRVTINGEEYDRSRWLKEGASEGDEVRIEYQ